MDDLTVIVAENGRVVLPSAVRRRLDVLDGGTIVIREEQGRLVQESATDPIRRAQAIVQRFAPGALGLTDELLAERRAGAMHEES